MKRFNLIFSTVILSLSLHPVLSWACEQDSRSTETTKKIGGFIDQATNAVCSLPNLSEDDRKKCESIQAEAASAEHVGEIEVAGQISPPEEGRPKEKHLKIEFKYAYEKT